MHRVCLHPCDSFDALGFTFCVSRNPTPAPRNRCCLPSSQAMPEALAKVVVDKRSSVLARFPDLLRGLPLALLDERHLGVLFRDSIRVDCPTVRFGRRNIKMSQPTSSVVIEWLSRGSLLQHSIGAVGAGTYESDGQDPPTAIRRALHSSMLSISVVRESSLELGVTRRAHAAHSAGSFTGQERGIQGPHRMQKTGPAGATDTRVRNIEHSCTQLQLGILYAARCSERGHTGDEALALR